MDTENMDTANDPVTDDLAAAILATNCESVNTF